jgi:hypothetical protein
MVVVNVRAAVERVDREIAALATVPPVLHLAWSQLVSALALGPAAMTRDCPYCGNPGIREATICGYCWKKLVPVHD